MRIELVKLNLVGRRITYQDTGDAGLLITTNGRLCQRAWFKNDFLEDFFKVVSTLCVELPRIHNAIEK